MVILLSFAIASTTFADKLHLKDGTIIKGNAKRDGDIWKIVTEDGDSLEFTTKEVKRHIYESRVTPAEAARMMSELNELIEPAFRTPEPNQFVWLGNVREYSNSFSYSSGSLTANWGKHSQLETGNIKYGQYTARQGTNDNSEGSSNRRATNTTVRGRSIDGVFVDQWDRYIAHFESLAKDLRYRELTRRRKYSGSLAEFAMWPPEHYEKQGEYVKAALDALDECINLANRSQRLVSLIPNKQRQLEADIARAERSAANAKDRLNAATNEKTRESRKNKLLSSKDKLRFRVVTLKDKMAKATQYAENGIRKFARHRVVTTGAIARAMEEMGTVFIEHAPNTIDVPKQMSFPLAEAISQGLDEIEKYRRKCKGLAPLGLESLRSETQANIREIFTGRKFVMGLYFKTNDHAEAGRYKLVAEDRSVNQGTSHLRATLFFDQAWFNDLSMCTRNEELLLLASIQEVDIQPSLQALETSSVEPLFHLQGTVISVERGCKKIAAYPAGTQTAIGG